jgi:signal transduction histidine kinase/AraC-like DNA-binding protein/AmiR/NasT family two-component response regulator
MGGYGGYITFRPQDIKVDIRHYPVRLTSFRLHDTSILPDMKIHGKTILDSSITLSNQIHLRYNQNVFRINFALLNFAGGASNKYSYKLQGYDKSWSVSDGEHNYAAYSHIPPGRYTFQVNAANSDNIWSAKPAQVTIIVHAAWWRSTVAYISYTLLFALLCVWVIRLIRTRVRLARELKLEIMYGETYKEVNQAKMAFFTNISHEFKTPLTLILGPIETLLDSASEGQRKMLLIMKQNAERLLRLINQIMDMRKIDDNKMKISMSMGDIVSFGHEVFLSFCDHARQRRINYNFVSHPAHIYMLFDRDKIEKVFYNLLSNAFKFTPDGGYIDMSIDEVFDGANEVRITVKDTGCGIDSEECRHIFDRFYQTDNIPQEQSEGSGIGLTLTKDYVNLHGGEIEVESTPGMGSKFMVILSCRSELYDMVSIDSEAAVADEAQVVSGNTAHNNIRKIVVVEDNEQMLKFIETTLSGAYDVYTATDGQKGLEVIRKVYPDLIISDMMMPRMDGLEMCSLVKQDALTSHIPLIMLTAKSDETDRVASYNCGADAFISKPFSVKTLITRIEVLVESRIRLQKIYRDRMLSGPSDIEVESENDKFILKLIRIIEENLENPDFNIQILCENIDSSYQYVYRKVKALTGETINDFVRTIKLKRAAQYLCKGEMRISEIMYKSGFNSHSYFTKCFKEYFGMTPKEYVEHFHNTQ